MRINAFNIIQSISGTFDGNVYKILADGTNIVFKYSWLPGLPNLTTEAMITRYNSLSKVELQKWDKIAKNIGFYSQYQAFASSFFLYITQYGLAKAIVDPIPYKFSQNRSNRIKQFNLLVSHSTGEADILKMPKTGFGTKGFGSGSFGTKRQNDIAASLKSLSKYNKTLVHCLILPVMRTEQDISEASFLNLVKPKTGFGTGTYSTGTFGTTR